MCILRVFRSDSCGHSPQKVEFCSRPTICKRAMMVEILQHPGECPDCLDGHYFPLTSYTVIGNEYPEAEEADSTVIDYSQSLMNYLVTWLTKFYADWATGDDVPPETGLQGDIPLDIGLRGTHDLDAIGFAENLERAQLDEVQCQYCDRKPVRGQRCGGCDVTANATREYRLGGAKTWDHYAAYATNEDDGSQPRELTANPIYHSWPLPLVDALDRQEYGLSITASLLSEIHPSSDEDVLYVTGVRIVMEVACWLIAYDSGVPRGHIPKILRLLAPMAHPSRDLQWYTWSETWGKVAGDNFRWTMMAYIWFIPDAVQKLILMTDQLEVDLYKTRATQHQIVNARCEGLYVQRLRHHSTFPAEIDPDMDCGICLGALNGAVEDDEHRALRLNRCGHQFHFECLMTWVLAAGSKYTTCPYCRQTFDSLDSTEDRRLLGMEDTYYHPREDILAMTEDGRIVTRLEAEGVGR